MEEENKDDKKEVKEVLEQIVQEDVTKEEVDLNAENNNSSKKEKKSGFFFEMWEKYKVFVKDYILTNIMIWVLAFVVQLYDFFESLDYNDYACILIGLICSIAWMFAVETFKKKKDDRIVFYIGGYILAIISALVVRHFNEHDYFEYIIAGLFSIYCSLGLITLYRLYIDSGLKWGKYILKVMGNEIIAGIVQGLITAGLVIISGILFEFVLEGLFKDTSDLYIRELLLIASLIAPSISLYAIVNVKTKIEYNLIEVLFSYVVTPIVTIAISLLYLYILRIILLRELAATAMFGIVFALFIPAYMVWVICINNKDEKSFIYKIAKKLPYCFMPLLLLQAYGIFLRINQYGVTSARYGAVMLLILEILAIALTVYKEGKYIGRVLWVISALLIISFCMPYINIYEVQAISQSNRLKQIMPEGKNFRDLSKEDRKSVKSIYNILYYDELGKKYLPDYIKEQEDSIDNYNSYNDSFYDDYNYNNSFFNDYYDYNSVTNTIQEV